MDGCIVLNADFSYLNTISWKRAIKLMLAQKVRVVKESDKVVRFGQNGAIRIPSVVALIKLIRIIFRGRVPFSKQNLIIRENGQCAYCGKKTKALTIDHIIPRSRNGETSFENCVAACRICNHKKGARTPNEAGMRLMVRPVQPTISEFLRKKMAGSGVLDILKKLNVY